MKKGCGFTPEAELELWTNRLNRRNIPSRLLIDVDAYRLHDNLSRVDCEDARLKHHERR
jgi:hypothetical protein